MKTAWDLTVNQLIGQTSRQYGALYRLMMSTGPHGNEYSIKEARRYALAVLQEHDKLLGDDSGLAAEVARDAEEAVAA